MVFIPQRVEAAAPANMILMGEYAVVDGAPAVMMTLPRRLTVRLEPAAGFCIASDMFGMYAEGQGGAPPAHAVLVSNVLECFAAATGLRAAEVRRLRVDIQSDIPPTYGFGSSAALVAALLQALAKMCGGAADFKTLFSAGRAAVLKTHGRGSGADLAAALADRPFVVFDPAAVSVRDFVMPYRVQAIYTGYKTPTPEVIRRVEAQVPADTRRAVVADMASCVSRFIAAPDVAEIGAYQGLMVRLGVACAACCAAVDAFAAVGAVGKISGSGMGDCVAGFSEAPVHPDVRAPFVFLPEEGLRRAANG